MPAGVVAIEPKVALAEDRTHGEVWDRDTGAPLTLDDYMGDAAGYGDAVERKRVALETELVEGRVRFVCPWCREPMGLRSVFASEKTEKRFYFKHQRDTGECSGSRGRSMAEICARKFGQCKEGVQHKRLKAWMVECLEADGSFSHVDPEKRWKDIDGVRWRQPDVQAVHSNHRVAFEVQLSTTFLHVIAQRMSFYKRNDGRLLWLFRDLDPTDFHQAEDDLFYTNNRNAFRISAETVALSKAHGRFALECAWHRPTIDQGEVVDVLERGIVFFDELTFDVSSAGVPRAFHFDYDRARLEVAQEAERLEKDAQDQGLRDRLEAAMLTWTICAEPTDDWKDLRRQLRERGIELPVRLGKADGPFYLLQAAYSAKHGEPVACQMTNLMSLANNLFYRHKDCLWVFTVVMGHYRRGKTLVANGNVKAWKDKRDEYSQAWLDRDAAFKPDRRFDALLAFAFPEAAEVLRLSPSDPDAQHLARKGTTD